MKIGFDFDNTIVSYDALFHKVAIEQSLVPAEVPKSKLAVRDYLRKMGKEDIWIEMQGYVYGARMSEAEAYPGVIEFMQLARENGVPMAIVSHKTRHPFMGPKYDLHEAAENWVKSYLINGKQYLIEPDQIFFELTKEQKIDRIAETQSDFFIDDLPEIFQMPKFPITTERILFDPEGGHGDEGISVKFGSWDEIKIFFEEKWNSCS